MSKLSSSPDRHTFQRDCYLKSCAEKNQTPDPKVLEMYESWRAKSIDRVSDQSQPNLEYDLRTSPELLDKVRDSDVYAQNLYAVLCNNDFVKNEVWPTLKNQTWSCSWRYAGGIVADMQQKGDYINWYCSGIGGVMDYDDTVAPGYVPEGTVTDEIRRDLLSIGWTVVD